MTLCQVPSSSFSSLLSLTSLGSSSSWYVTIRQSQPSKGIHVHEAHRLGKQGAGLGSPTFPVQCSGIS